jgi:lipopolysaccharide transport system ATP-binding protein
MSVRVEFAVATAVRPDVLIVDEALSVGDAAFQRKSFRRIEEFLAEGTSLLFVSHGADAVRNLCDRAIWLDRGRVRLEGDAKSVTESYEKDLFSNAGVVARTVGASDHGFVDASVTSSIEVEYGDGLARIRDLEIRNSLGQQVNVLPIGETFTISYVVEFFADCIDTHFGLLLKTVDGITVYGTNTDNAGLRNRFGSGDAARVSYTLKNNLCPGVYYLNCGASHAGATGRAYLHRRVDAAALRVLHGRHDQTIAGLAYLGAAIDISVSESVLQ